MTNAEPSVALAQLLAEDRLPAVALWDESLASSRLLQFELWNRIHARGLGRSRGEDVRQMLGRIALLELTPTVLGRALDPFPVQVRTLDALHLASAEFMRQQGQEIRIATYDVRMREGAQRLGIPVYEV